MAFKAEEAVYEGVIVSALSFGYDYLIKYGIKWKSNLSTPLSVLGGVVTKEWLIAKGYIKPIV